MGYRLCAAWSRQSNYHNEQQQGAGKKDAVMGPILPAICALSIGNLYCFDRVYQALLAEKGLCAAK